MAAALATLGKSLLKRTHMTCRQQYSTCSELFWHSRLRKNTLFWQSVKDHFVLAVLGRKISRHHFQFLPLANKSTHPWADILTTLSQMFRCLSLLLHVSSSCLFCQWRYCYYWSWRRELGIQCLMKRKWGSRRSESWGCTSRAAPSGQGEFSQGICRGEVA